MAFVSYEIENDREFQSAIDKAIKQIGSLKAPFKQISNDFYRSEKAIFRLKSQGQYPDFKNEESRQSKERAVGFDYPLLKRTGRLMRSVTEPDEEGSINEITDLSLTIGTNIKNKKGYMYPAVHQFGSKHVPMRKFLFIGAEGNVKNVPRDTGRLKRWMGYINSHVNKKLGIKWALE